jgi:SAM-dependent methyltransferase
MMNSTQINSDERVGWEQIWCSGDIPPRYRSLAAPNDTVVEWAATVQVGGTILDVGCGVGRHVTYLGGLGFSLAGVDISPTGVQQTKEICAERGVVFDGRISDMNTLPWPDNTFVAALSTSTIHHHRRAGITRALAEIWRVLQPGGLFLVDFPSTDTLTYQELRRQVEAGEISEVEPNTFVDERPDSDDPDGFLPHHFCDEADLRDLLRTFDILKLEADLHEVQLDIGSGLVGKWVAWVRRPLL